MATQNDEPLITASSRASLADYPDGEAFSKQEEREKRSRRRACPIIALLGLLIHLIISGSGVAVSVLVVHFNLQVSSAGTFDLVARVLLFVASCMGIFYVLMHAFAAREHYIRTHGSPQIFGYFTVAVAVLIMRLGVPVWMGSVVLTSIVASIQGFHVVTGLEGNVVWIQLAITSLGLISLTVMVVITETTERPFATSFFSKTSFLRGGSTSSSRVNTFDLSVSRAGHRLRSDGNGEGEKKGRTEVETKNLGFDRSTINTPESSVPASTQDQALVSPDQDDIRPLVRVRSQPIPTPLEAVFTSTSSPLDAQDSPRKLAWHPRQNSNYAPQRPQIATVPFGPRPLSNPRTPSSTTPRESSSERFSVQTQLVPEPDKTSTDSIPDAIMPPSPALGTPIAIPTSAVLRIANPDEDEVQQQEPPTLAKLLGQLSSRAAARRRNSLLVRQAELAVRPATGEPNIRADSRVDMAAVLFDQPADYAGTSQENPVQRRNSLLVSHADLDVRRSISVTRTGEMSVFSLDPSTEFIEIPRPPQTEFRAMTAVNTEQSSEPPRLARSDTADPVLVRNFSRPGAPRPRTAGGEEDGMVRGRSTDRRGRNDTRGEKSLARRSRSLPPARQNHSNTAGDETQLKTSTSVRGNKKSSQVPITPRFSPFPKAPVAGPPFEVAKKKGLGQGSTRRLDERIEKWMNTVPIGEG
ncbi:hypothetical protein N0V93_006009 [Gnomoniopsis smithogilvyi]|uniref:Uncharacterized protein n=1 Tax=Gnomoniopsis smithogilvyi TaxID=1191159 RepID=A0A9W9CV69_9PEZI|nr:hypothetical protein N0V93_006009 [Gnomoniopsis smithogilvyi]